MFTNGSAIYICAYSSIFSKKICTRTQNFFLIMGMIKCTNVLTSILCCSNYGGIETDLQTEWYVVLSLTFSFFVFFNWGNIHMQRIHMFTNITNTHQHTRTPSHTRTHSRPQAIRGGSWESQAFVRKKWGTQLPRKRSFNRAILSEGNTWVSLFVTHRVFRTQFFITYKNLFESWSNHRLEHVQLTQMPPQMYNTSVVASWEWLALSKTVLEKKESIT